MFKYWSTAKACWRNRQILALFRRGCFWFEACKFACLVSVVERGRDLFTLTCGRAGQITLCTDTLRWFHIAPSNSRQESHDYRQNNPSYYLWACAIFTEAHNAVLRFKTSGFVPSYYVVIPNTLISLPNMELWRQSTCFNGAICWERRAKVIIGPILNIMPIWILPHFSISLIFFFIFFFENKVYKNCYRIIQRNKIWFGDSGFQTSMLIPIPFRASMSLVDQWPKIIQNLGCLQNQAS